VSTATTSTFRKLPRDPGWVRYDPIQTAHDGIVRETVHVLDGQDTSPTWNCVTNYDPKCGWCWLGYCHSTAEHEHSTASA
jgi:hypothetical protein